jgi:hypothetical protein
MYNSLDSELAPLLLPEMERMRLLGQLVENALAKGMKAESILALIDD